MMNSISDDFRKIESTMMKNQKVSDDINGSSSSIFQDFLFVLLIEISTAIAFAFNTE